MRILILGGNGMIGHKIYQTISKENKDVWVTLRNKLNTYHFSYIYDSQKVVDQLDILDLYNFKNKLDEIMPDIIVNACGITIRRGLENIKSNTIILNSVLPHFLNEWVTLNNKRLIHFSTDCVFSGTKGNYNDNDIKDSTDFYGSSKSIGEVIDSKHAITIRASMIGRELENKTELFEWLFSQKNKTISGYSEVIYSGITTVKMSEFVLRVINKFPKMNGVYNISSKPISKFDLLELCNKKFELNINIKKDNSYKSNKNIISDKFFKEIGIKQPEWIDLIDQFKEDCLQYYNLYN